MRTGICLVLATALLASSAYAAKVKPISELTGFPENDEEFTLWQLAGTHEAKIEENQRRYSNPEVEAYVKSIVMKMIGPRLDHVNVDIEIILVREPTLSAWVYPYGNIAVHTGLLAGMENEAQLAAILGHEISHFLHRHSYRELIVENQQSAFGKGLGFLVSAAVAAETGRMPTNLVSGVGNFWTGLVTNGYSRKLEHAADEGGLELMADANYDRAQALLAFEALKQNDVYGTVDVSTLWSSHPPSVPARLHRRHVPVYVNVDIEIILVREPTLSAWVYPYGNIAVHTGLLAGMENEAQLAAILGHEISHFLHRHSYRELIVENQQSAFGKGLGFLVSAAVAAETGRMPTNLVSGVGNFWTGLVTNGYSRKLEHAADEGGLELMADANYDRAQALLAFEALKQNDVYGTVDVSTLWSSHPTLEDRLKNLDKNIKREARQKNYQPGSVPEAQVYDNAIAPVLLFNASIDLRERFFGRAQTALKRYLTVRQEPMAEFLLGESIRKAEPDGPDLSDRLAAYGRAISLDADFAPAHKERGMALRQQGNTSEASREFRRYLNLTPDAADAGIIRGYMTDME